MRRQERRKKEAEAKAGEALSTSKQTEIGINVSDSSQVDPKDALENSNLTEKSIPPSISFKCDQCNFLSVSEKSVKQHKRIKHRISQLDGLEDIEESESDKSPCPLCPVWIYCKCGNCEECDYISTEKGLNVHIMNDHEPQEVIQHFEANWIHNQKHLIKRNYYYAQDRFHSQKWDSAMVL